MWRCLANIKWLEAAEFTCREPREGREAGRERLRQSRKEIYIARRSTKERRKRRIKEWKDKSRFEWHH